MSCLGYASKLDQDVYLQDADQSIYIYVGAVAMSHDVFGLHGTDPCSEIRHTEDERIFFLKVYRQFFMET